MTSFADYNPHKPAAAISPSSPKPADSPHFGNSCPTPKADAARPSGVISRVRRFFAAVIDFIAGDSGVEAGWPCLRCSSVSHAVRDFIAKWWDSEEICMLRLEHGGGIAGAIAARLGIDQRSIVIHDDGEDCPRARIGQCLECLVDVELDAISDGCPVSAQHFVANKRAKPRTYKPQQRELTGAG